ncbi:MAG: FAD-dependent oxidoreductase [Thermoplasmata archaeon]|nr:MAG: FAD-dependent oxidoreductase [Thermoplasmata archaeon]
MGFVMTISEPRKIVIVGLGTGGLYSAKTALGFNRKAEITIIEKRPYDMFSPCGLPFAIEGVVGSFEDLKYDVPDHLRRMKKMLAHEVQSINPSKKTVEVKNLDTWETKNIEYDSLVLATGGRPILLPVPGAKELIENGVYFVSTIENSEMVRSAAEKAKHAVMIGGGPIGLEIAIALKARGVELAITKRSPPVFPKVLDVDMGEIVEKYLREQNFKLFFGKKTERINTDDDGNISSVTIEGEDVPADMVVMGVGTEANTDLALQAGLEVGKYGIKVDDHLRTSDPNIYALGDCIESFNLVNKQPMPSQLATAAFLQGHVVGVNAAGGEVVYEGDLATFATVIGELEIAAVGFNTPSAEDAGFKVISGKSKGKSKPEYMPGSAPVTVKIIIDKENGKILGGQVIAEKGGGGAGWRVNLISMAIRTGMTIDQFAEIELAYTPPISEVYDPLSMASEFGAKKYNQLQK